MIDRFRIFLSIDNSRSQIASTINKGNPLPRSITVAGDKSTISKKSSILSDDIVDDNDPEQRNLDDSGPSKLRTFRGRKRDTAHLDRSRLTKGLMRSHVNHY